MADSKISALTALTGANVEHTADSMVIVDDSVTTTKRILVSELAKGLHVLGTEQASTSGTSIDFTSIPAWARRISINLVGVSTNGSSQFLVQIGDSGGIETSGYLGTGLSAAASTSGVNNTGGFGLNLGAAGNVMHGRIVLELEDEANFTWTAMGVVGLSNSATIGLVAGSKSLSAALDRVRLTTANGSDTFDAGAVNILYE